MRPYTDKNGQTQLARTGKHGKTQLARTGKNGQTQLVRTGKISTGKHSLYAREKRPTIRRQPITSSRKRGQPINSQ